jgi:hypothetical protein
MFSSLDSKILIFFGFTEKDIIQILDRPELQILYSLMITPRKRFEKRMVLNLPDDILLRIYDHLISNSEVPITQNILDESITSSKKNSSKFSRIKLLKTMFGFLNPKGSNDIISPIITITENSELLGDAILASLVNDIVLNLPNVDTTKYYIPCIQTLKRFLNSNVALHHILKSVDIDITQFVPDIEKEKIRLGKRIKPKSPKEKITKSCIDYKYTANLFEQMIAFLYINKGYEYTYQVFNLILADIGFDPRDFFYFCMYNFQIPYPKIILEPGCSCKNVKTKKSICDNPGLYEPKNFVNLKCPEKCSYLNSKFYSEY